MEHRDATYEWLRAEVSSIERAPDPRDRRLVWAAPNHSLALSRDGEGRVEVFVPGEPLDATVKSVAQVLEHRVWTADDGEEFAANRLVLPFGEHFDHFGALLCVELLEHELAKDRQGAFSAVEPLIALALTREMITDLTIVGMLGELSMLEALLKSAAPNSREDVLRSWAGSAPSARDFQLGNVGVEVKTTQGPASIHHIEGVHQVEIGHANHGGIETDLFMLSLGLGWVADPNQGRSLPEVVDAILERVPDEEGRADLLARIKQYGGDAAVGYDHERDRNKPRYATRFYVRFERLYDMCDERLELLTSASLGQLRNIDTASVTFRVVLDDRVRGVHNPIVGWNALVERVLDTAGITREE